MTESGFGRATLRALTEADRVEFVAVMGAAFAQDPWYRVLFASARGPAVEDHHRRAFLGFLFEISCWTGSTLRGVVVDGALGGAYILDRPGSADLSAALAWPRVMVRALTGPIGLSWRRAGLIAAYLRHTRAALPRGRSYYLALLGVRPDLQGRGFGRRLLADLIERVDADPRADGIGLDTENAENIGLYQRFGFGLASTAQVGSARVYCLYRARP